MARILMDGVSITVIGTKEVVAALGAFDKEVEKELVRLSKAGADIVAATTRNLAPVRTGRLRNSVQVEKASAGSTVTLSGLAYIGPIVNGWPRHHIKANRFPQKALADETDKVVDIYRAGIEALIHHQI